MLKLFRSSTQQVISVCRFIRDMFVIFFANLLQIHWRKKSNSDNFNKYLYIMNIPVFFLVSLQMICKRWMNSKPVTIAQVSFGVFEMNSDTIKSICKVKMLACISHNRNLFPPFPWLFVLLHFLDKICTLSRNCFYSFFLLSFVCPLACKHLSFAFHFRMYIFTIDFIQFNSIFQRRVATEKSGNNNNTKMKFKWKHKKL